MATTVERQEVRLELTGLKQVESGLRSLVTQMDQRMRGLHDVTSRIQSSTLGLVTRIGAAVGALAGGAGFAAVIKSGLEFNSVVENARLGIAAVQKQLDPARFKTFDQAVAASADAIDLLKEKAKVSPATFEQLTEGFQAVTGAATGAGIGLKDQVDLIVLMSQALSGLGIRSEQLIQESRALISGNINHNAAAARILNITADDIKRATQAGQLFEFLTGKLDAFREAGIRGATTWTTLWSNLKDVLTQTAGTATMPFFEVIKAGLEDLLKFDWEAVGIRIGGFVDVVIKAWRDGNIDKLIVLTIRAGWEQVEEWSREGVAKVFNSQAIMDGLTRAAVAMGMALLRGIKSALFDGLLLLIEMWANNMQTTLRLFTGAWSVPIRNALREATDQALALAHTLGEKAGASVDLFEEKLRESLGIQKTVTDETGKELNARQQLNALITEAVGKRQAEAKAAKEAAGAIPPPTPKPAASQKGAAKQTIDEMERARADAERERAMIDADFRTPEAQKRGLRINALKREQGLVASQRGTLLEEANKPGMDPAEREDLLSGARGLEKEGRGLGTELGREEASADPFSFSDQMTEKLVDLEDQIGTFAESTAEAISGVIGSAIDGVAGSIEGLIKGTMDWGDALQNIAGSIMNAVISGIARMFAEWIIKMTLLRALESMFSAQRKAQTASELPGNVANSAASSGGSWGASAIIGLAAFLALIGVALAMGGAFAKGGRPPIGRASIVGEQGPELFVPDTSGTILTAGMTERIMRGIAAPLAGMGTAGGRGAGAGGAPAINSAPGPAEARRKGVVNVVMVDDRNAARDYLRTSEGESHILDVVRRNAVSVGIPT